MGNDPIGTDHPRAQGFEAFPGHATAQARGQDGERVADALHRLHRGQLQAGIGIAQGTAVDGLDRGAVEPALVVRAAVTV